MNADATSPPTATLDTGCGTDWLIGGGEMAKLIKAMDWSKTPLGPIDTWPQSLRTVVSLAQASNSPISLSWGAHHVQIYNDGYWPICGDKHPRSMGQDFRECWAAPWPFIGEAYASACAGKTAYLENMRMFLDRYGFLEETWFTFSFSPITDESGKVAGLFHPVTELTGQSLSERRTKTLRDLATVSGKSKTSQDALETCANLFAEANLDLPFVLFYLVHDDGRRAQLIAQTGLPVGSAVCPDLADLTAGAADPWSIAEVIRSGRTQQLDNVAAQLAGLSVGPYPELPNGALALPLRLPGQERPAGVMVAGISARLRMSEPYRGFVDLVAATVSTALASAQAHEDARRKAEALAEIDRAKTVFFSNVSHEFRTPLTLMLGPLEDELNERDDPLPQSRRERIETAHRNSLRLLKLVNGLLDFSRIEAGRIQALYEPTDLAALTADLASSFRSAIERGGLTLTVDCPPLPEALWVDRDMWEKVVLNLLSNAFKFTLHGGISVRLAWTGGGARLTVEDSGVGIAAAEIPRMFERFHRIKGSASRTHEGTGIGLSLARELVQLHGGEIQVESELGKYTRFIVTLKAGKAHLPAEKIASHGEVAATTRMATAYVQEALHWLPSAQYHAAEQEHGLDPGAALAILERSVEQPRILLADDNADMRHYVARLLGHNYQVQAVADGKAALEAALAVPPDLILSDVMMPQMDGFELLKALRSDERTRRLPVILLSARAGEESSLQGLEAGADDYLAKPFSAKELLARVRSNLSLAQLRKEWEAKLSQTNQELAEAVAAKERFLATMSHEIRTPLNAVMGMAGILADSPLTAEQREFAHIIRSSGDHLLSVINDILDYSRLESGKFALERIPFSVSELVEEALDMVALSAREKKLELAYELSPALPPTVLGDPGRVRQVLLNFLSNAVKFTERGEVLVTVLSGPVTAGSMELKILVRDTGIGLTAGQSSRLFQPFAQAEDSTSRKYGGSGLGLAISRKLVEFMGGRAGVESAPGMGTIFFFSFLAGLPSVRASTVARAVDSPQLNGLRAWIIDDNDSNRRILRRQAVSWGMVVRETALPLEALKWSRAGERCDVAIIDQHMPVMDGMQLAAELHRIHGPAIRQILLSSVGETLDPVATRQIGVYAQLAKPVRHSALFNSVARLFEGTVRAAVTDLAPSVATADSAPRQSLRILVAEDNALNVKVIRIVLEQLGYRCDVAGNGLEVIAALRRQPYDVVLMDVRMPEMDGIEATRRIFKEWDDAQRPRIIALTAGVMPHERQACLDAGIEEFLNKPLRRDELLQALARCPQLGGQTLRQALHS